LYSDITLVVGKEKIPAHRIVLCSWSETFRLMLENDVWKESHQQELPVAVEEKETGLFKKMLEYMYTGTAEIQSDEVVPLLAMANYYGVFSLKDHCGEILGKNVDIDSVFYLLEISHQYSCNKLDSDCAEYLAENFGEMLKKDKLMQLDPGTWAKMLQSDDIQVSSEEDVFEAVLRYTDQYEKAKRLAALEEILPSVRFPLLSSEYLVDKVEGNPKLDGVKNLHTLLHDTFRYKAYPASVPTVNVNPRKGITMFDEENSHPNVTISSDRVTATCSDRSGSGNWTTCRCSPAFPEGISYREFKIRFTSYMMLGVETKQNNPKANQYPGQTSFGWCWYSAGQTYHGNINSGNTSIQYASGDTIGLLYDSHSGKLVFYKNQQPQKVFFNISTKEPLFAAVSFYSGGDSATILTSAARLPSKWPKGMVNPIEIQTKRAQKKEKKEKKKEDKEEKK